jgi:aspartyl-tRNA(Asn)/glutamyl-tRNA(Gln) amidotransferase subunit C
MISKDEVKHIAKLARLELTEKEIEKMQKDLSEILDYFNLLKRADKLSAKETGLAQEGKMIPRKDEVEISNGQDKIVAAAPDEKNGYIKVKTIL